LHGFEQLLGKVVGLKMKNAIPTAAEHFDIWRPKESVDLGIGQLQMRETLNDDVQARVPLVQRYIDFLVVRMRLSVSA